jgi:peptide-methionine (S)-S-oxide reductase
MKTFLSILFLLLTSGASMAENDKQIAIFAGGCFWCMEPEFANIEGVSEVTSGYIGGKTENPTYEQVSKGNTGHYEAIKVVYNPKQVSYKRLLDIFWENIDPLDPYGQFCDKGSQYLAGIFTSDDEQKTEAETSKAAIAKKFEKPIATIIKPASIFYPAEDYHQEFYIKSRDHYKRYRAGCGRDERLEQLRNIAK